MAIVVCVISFFLLTSPVITGYYFAVHPSRREEYFLDLVNTSRPPPFLLAGVMVGIMYLFAPFWRGEGFFVELGLCFTLALLFAKRIIR